MRELRAEDPIADNEFSRIGWYSIGFVATNIVLCSIGTILTDNSLFCVKCKLFHKIITRNYLKSQIQTKHALI